MFVSFNYGEFKDYFLSTQINFYVLQYVKRHKIYKIDIVGFLSKKGKLGKDEVGRIDVKDHYAFAAISRKKVKQALGLIRNEKIKGVKTIIEEAK